MCFIFFFFVIYFCFFFSSRRRHTSSLCDWVQTCALPICVVYPPNLSVRLSHWSRVFTLGRTRAALCFLLPLLSASGRTLALPSVSTTASCRGWLFPSCQTSLATSATWPAEPLFSDALLRPHYPGRSPSLQWIRYPVYGQLRLSVPPPAVPLGTPGNP